MGRPLPPPKGGRPAPSGRPPPATAGGAPVAGSRPRPAGALARGRPPPPREEHIKQLRRSLRASSRVAEGPAPEDDHVDDLLPPSPPEDALETPAARLLASADVDGDAEPWEEPQSDDDVTHDDSDLASELASEADDDGTHDVVSELASALVSEADDDDDDAASASDAGSGVGPVSPARPVLPAHASVRLVDDKRMKDDETTASIAVAQGAADFVDSQQIKMDVEFVILGAFGLGRADSWGKGADPYVVVVAVPPKGAEVIVGKTAVSRNTLDPRWENQTFTVVVPYDDANEAFTVRLDVFDSDRVGAHACLGQLVLDRDYMLEAPRLEAQIRELEAPGRQRSKVAPPTDGYYGALEFRTHISARVVVYAQGARNLCRAGGAGKADPYAAARWLGHKARKVGRTVAVKGSLSPTWDHAFVLAIPVLRQDRGGRLQIDVWGNDYLGADDFLGRANLEADFILRQRTTETFSLPLQKRKPHDKVQGHLECRVYVPKQIYDLVTRLTVASACLTNNTIPRCHVRVKVLFATNIRNADCCGYRGGDPYAVVYRDGKKVGRTPARSKTRNPVWETSNLFVLENVPTKIVEPERWDTTLHDLRAPPQKGWFGAKKKRGSTSPVKAGAPSKPDDSSDDDGADSDEEEGASDVAAGGVKARPPLGPTQTSRRKSLMDPRLHEEMATDMPGENDDVDGGALREHALASRGEARRRGEPHVDVRIDLFDDDLVSRDFLGTAAVPWATLMRPGEHSISVTERPGTLIRPVAARFRITGTVTISVSHVSIIEACVTEGVDLAMLDSWDVSDPYAIVKWNSKKLAKTKVRDNDLDPKWYGGRFTVDVPLEPEPDEDSPLELCVEVWEKDALSGDDFMGLATIPTEALLWPSPGLPRLLSRRPGKPEDPNPQGYIELEIRSSFVPGVLEPRRAEGLRFRPVQGPAPDAPAAEITMKVLRAGGLLVMDLFGGADPFVIVRKDGRVVGRTATRNDTLRPVWKDAAFNFSYALSDDGTVVDSNSEIRVEVWDADFAGKSLMGLARLGVPQLMACGVVRYALQPERPSKAFYDRPEANDPGLGWIEVDCALYASLTLEVDRADGLRAADASGTSDAYVKARWAGAQARDLGRSDVEKRTLDPRWAFRVSLSVPLTTPTNQFAALVLEVWDHDASGGDEFLGLCAIDPHELVTGADDGASKTTRLLDKSASGHVKKEALGTLTWRVHRHKPVRALRRLLAQALKDELTRNTLDGATVKFEVLRCGELPSVGGGLADSYVKVFCHGLKVGQTTVVEHSRNPHWPGDGSQVFTLRDVATKHGAQARDHFLLRLTVFHSNAVGADDTLGEAAMGWDHLMQEGEHTLTLRERVFDTKRASAQATALKKQMASYAQRRNKGPQNAQRGSRDETPEERGAGPGLGAAGAAGPALGDARRASAALRRLGPNVVVRVWHISRVRLHLVGGLGLRAADVSLLGGLAASDPYAVVRFLGKKVSKTRICRATLDPVWNHVVDLDLPTFQPGGVGARTELLIEVWDSDALGTDDLLGVVAVSHDELVRPHRGDVFELGPRPNAPPGAPRPTGCLHIAIEASFIPLSHEPVRWPRHPDVGEALASYYRRGDDGQNVGDLELRQLAQRLQASAEDLAKEAASRAWEHRDISSAVDAKSGRRFWYERLAGAARARAAETGNFAECRRWWYDPRPAPVPPSRTFDLPPLPPRPSPTKRAYLRLNEPLPGDDHYAFKACVVVEVVVLRARGLRNADSALLGGKSDPYAVVRHGPPAQRETVGRTRVVRDSLDPVWGDEPMRFACGLDAECAAQELLVEVWDSDGAAAKLLGGRDDALGQCTILPSEYLNATGPIRKALRPQPGEPAVTGWIELKINLLGRVRLLYDDVRPALDPIAQLEMSLKSLDAPRGGEPAPPALAPQWSASMYDGAAASLFDGAAASVPQLQLAAGDGADGGALAGALAASKSRASLARRASSRGPRYECAATWIGWHERLLSTVRAARGSATALQAVVVDVPLQREGGFVDVDVWRLGGGATKAAAAKSKSRVGNAAVSTADLLQEGLPTLHLALDGRPKSVRRTAKRHDAMVLLARVDCPAPLARLARAARASRELQETANTVPALDGLEIDVLRAFNLQVADSQLSDPFVVAWHRGVKVGQTRVKKNTLNPVWEHDGPSATFPLRHFRTADDAWGTDVGGAPAFDRDERCVLLEVWDSDGVGRRPDFLGHCVLRHADLLRGGDHELLLHELEFQDLEKDVQWARKRPARQRRRAWCCARAAYQCLRCLTCPARAFGKCAAAALCLCCACAVGISRRCCRSLCPCLGCCARKAPVRGRLFVRVRHRATVHLRICEAFGLMAADKGILGGGSSDPYCVVEYKGEKLAQTRVRSGTRDALYYEALQLTIDVPLSPFGWDADDGAPDGALRWDHPGRAFQRANGYALTITVWDRDTFSKDDFLGQVVLRPEALLRPQNGTAWPLKPRNAADIADLDGEASGGLGFLQLEVCASHVPGSLAPELRRQHGALGRYDEAMNAAGRAYYYDAWTRETFWNSPEAVALAEKVRRLDARPQRQASVRGWLGRKRANPYDVVSQSRLTMQGAAPLVESGTVGGAVVDLELDAAGAAPQCVFKLTVVRAMGLDRADTFGKSDPYVVVRCAGHKVGRTKTIKQNLDPEWLEDVVFAAPLPTLSPAEVQLEVWDWDAVGLHDLLGTAYVKTTDLLKRTGRLITLPLSGRPGGKNAGGTLLLRPEVYLRCALEICSASRVRGAAQAEQYVSVSWSGLERGKSSYTATCFDGLGPVWDERRTLLLPLRFPTQCLTVELREHRRQSEDAFVGRVNVDAAMLAGDAGRGEDPPPRRFALVGEDDEQISRPLPNQRRGSHIPDPAKMRRIIEAQWDAVAADEMASGEADSKTDEAAQKNPLLRLGNGLTDVDGTAKDGSAKDVPAKDAAAGKKVIRRAQKGPAPVPQPAGKKAPARGKGCLANCFAPRRADGDAAQPAEAPPAAAANARQVEADSDAALDARSENGDEVGDVLTLRFSAQRDVSQLFSEARAAWRQRPSANEIGTLHAEVEILRCDGLRPADFFSGKSDPFVVLTAGGDAVGKTRIVFKSLNPKWAEERFLLPFFAAEPKNALEASACRVEFRVMDHDALGADDFLGYQALDHAALLESLGTWRTIDLKADPDAKDEPEDEPAFGSSPTKSKKKKAVAGWGKLTFRVQLVARVGITLVGAHGLGAGGRAPDTYARVLYLGERWGADTKVCADTTRPVWFHSVELKVPVPADGNYGEPARVEIYDKIGKGVLIGVAEIPHEELCYPHDCPGLRPVVSRDGGVGAGALEVLVEASRCPRYLEPRRRPSEAAVYGEALDPRNDRPYWFDVCTGERFWDDPRPAAEALAQQLAQHAARAKLGDAEALPVALLRAQKGFPEAPRGVAAAAQGGAAARVWWSAPRPNGPPVFGYTVERQRKVRQTHELRQTLRRNSLLNGGAADDDDAQWLAKGSVYVDTHAQAASNADEASRGLAAERGAGVGASYAGVVQIDGADLARPPPTQCVVDALADGVYYRFRVVSHNAVGTSKPSGWSNACLVMRPLPDGWVEVLPEDGRAYYHNVKTLQTNWMRPELDSFYLPADVFLRFSASEIDHLKKVFVEKDLDKSNAISLREFEACLPALGEVLSASDLLWLFYQADLDPSAELSFTHFARCVDTLKRARVDRAPLLRRCASWAAESWDNLTRPRLGARDLKLLALKDAELKRRFGCWEKVEHPELPGQKYWLNRETGAASYSTPDAIKFYVPEALLAEAATLLEPHELAAAEEQFERMDLDGSGAVDAQELKVLMKGITGKTLSDGRCRGLVREIDADGSGCIDFDEFVLILVALRRGLAGSAWSQIGEGMQDTDVHAHLDKMKVDADEHLLAARRSAKRPHGYYCVCGCRAIHADVVRERRARRSIFPKLSPQQLRRQAGGGGATAAVALATSDALSAAAYTASTLVAKQQRARPAEPDEWSMQQRQHKADHDFHVKYFGEGEGDTS